MASKRKSKPTEVPVKTAQEMEYERESDICKLANKNIEALTGNKEVSIYDMISYAKWTVVFASILLHDNSLKGGEPPATNVVVDDISAFAKDVLSQMDKMKKENADDKDAPAKE